MPDPLEYVITRAILQCSEGTVPKAFKATPRRVRIQRMCVGTAVDKLPYTNIPSFVICKKLTQMAGGTPVPCVPAPIAWQDTHPVSVNKSDILLFRSCIYCSAGQGKIEFVTSGQLPLSPEISQQLADMEQEGEELLAEAEAEQAAEANSVGEAGLLDGAIPIWGSGRDLIHAVQTGDGWGAALNAGFLVWDGLSIAAGLATLGGATVVMQAGKAALKTGIKMGVKGVAKAGVRVASKALKAKAAQMLAKAAAMKATLKTGKIVFGNVIVCLVKACFPAGTPVAMKDDYKAIEELKVGDAVWAVDEQTGKLALKPVVAVMHNQTNALVHLRIGGERLQATIEHPFATRRGWQQAGDLAVGDEIRRSDGEYVEVTAVERQEELAVPVSVYNIEVADWHTYLVGKWLWVVHNSTYCLWDAAKKILVGIGIKLPATFSTLKAALKGNGKTALEDILKKIENQAHHLSDSDVTGAVRDILGHPVIINGRKYDHLDEVTNAMSGLGRQIEKINKGIKDGTFTDEVLTEANRIRSALAKEKDRIANELERARRGPKI